LWSFVERTAASSTISLQNQMITMARIIVLCAAINQCSIAATCANCCHAELHGVELIMVEKSITLLGKKKKCSLRQGDQTVVLIKVLIPYTPQKKEIFQNMQRVLTERYEKYVKQRKTMLLLMKKMQKPTHVGI
jgi:hypothetical protein